MLTDIPQRRIDGIVAPYLSRRRNLSIALGIIRRGEQHVLGYGHEAAGETPPGDLIYEIGSVTKVFTASLLADLAREGVVRLDDPVRKFLPPGIRVPSFDGADITLEHLATHTSGLPRLPKNLKITGATRANPYANYSVDQMYAFLSSFRLSRRPPAPFAYSNLGYGLLGHALAAALGIGYEEAVRRRICVPLQMDDTRVELDAARRRRLRPGHSARGKPVPNWDIPTLAGAGALRSTAHDLLKFMAANLGLLRTPVAESLAICHQPRVAVDSRTHIGLGWLISEFHGHRLIWHNGATGGYSSYVGLIKEKGVGVCVLTNHSLSLLAAVGLTSAHADDIGRKVLQALLD